MASTTTTATPSGGSPQRRKWSPAQIITWVLVAAVGAVAWGVIAISRGEEISAAWLVFAALASYAYAPKGIYYKG